MTLNDLVVVISSIGQGTELTVIRNDELDIYSGFHVSVIVEHSKGTFTAFNDSVHFETKSLSGWKEFGQWQRDEWTLTGTDGCS